MEILKQKYFGNGNVDLLMTDNGKIIEKTLPTYIVNAMNSNCNNLIDANFGDRGQRWMIGVSTISGCPVSYKFCVAGGNFNGNLTSNEIIKQVKFIVDNNPNFLPYDSKEFKILFTRMGGPGLNYDNVNDSIVHLKSLYPNAVIPLSTVGLKNGFLDSWLYLSKEINNFHLQFPIVIKDKPRHKIY